MLDSDDVAGVDDVIDDVADVFSDEEGLLFTELDVANGEEDGKDDDVIDATDEEVEDGCNVEETLLLAALDESLEDIDEEGDDVATSDVVETDDVMLELGVFVVIADVIPLVGPLLAVFEIGDVADDPAWDNDDDDDVIDADGTLVGDDVIVAGVLDEVAGLRDADFDGPTGCLLVLESVVGGKSGIRVAGPEKQCELSYCDGAGVNGRTNSAVFGNTEERNSILFLSFSRKTATVAEPCLTQEI